MGNINQTDALPEDKSLIMGWFDRTWKSQLVAAEMSKTFYVDNTGDDSNIGDYNNPLRTFAEAVNRTPSRGRVYIYVKSNLNDASVASASDKTILVDILDNIDLVFEWVLDGDGKYRIRAFDNPKDVKFNLRNGATMKVAACPDPNNVHYTYYGIVHIDSRACDVTLASRNLINQDFLVLRDKACLMKRTGGTAAVNAITLTVEAYYSGVIRVHNDSYLLGGRVVGSYDVYLGGAGLKDENGNTRTPESCVQFKTYDADGNCKNLLSYYQTL